MYLEQGVSRDRGVIWGCYDRGGWPRKAVMGGAIPAVCALVAGDDRYRRLAEAGGRLGFFSGTLGTDLRWVLRFGARILASWRDDWRTGLYRCFADRVGPLGGFGSRCHD